MLTRETLQLGPTIYGAAEMRYYDGAANDEADRKRLEHLRTCDVFLCAAGEMIRHAIVAAKDKRCNQAEQLLGFHVERASFIGARVEREKAVDDHVSFAEDLRVHSLAKFAELLERAWLAVVVGDRASGRRLAIMRGIAGR